MFLHYRAGSLACNHLCGLYECVVADGDYIGLRYTVGTYTAEGVTKLCKALEGSAVTSLKYAATPHSIRLSVNVP